MTVGPAISVRTRVGLHGWETTALDVSTAEDPRGSWRLVSDGVEIPTTATDTAAGRQLVLDAPVRYPFAFELLDETGRRLATDASVSRVETAGAEGFVDRSDDGVTMRRYDPAAPGPHPLILFLHGGGEAGSDNWAQLVGTYGAIALAQRHPDHIVLAPQAPAGATPPTSLNAPFPDRALDPDSGWSRPYLAAVVQHIRGLIDAGRVDPDRVLVTGVSMGGAGTLRALSVAPDLFAAAAPVCPTMTPETFGYLTEVRVPVWVSSAYVDHTPDRHKYLMDGVLALLRAGADDAHITLFSPEQLRRVGIPSRDGLPLETVLAENHGSWALTYTDEDGILSWLVSRRRGDGAPEAASTR